MNKHSGIFNFENRGPIVTVEFINDQGIFRSDFPTAVLNDMFGGPYGPIIDTVMAIKTYLSGNKLDAKFILKDRIVDIPLLKEEINRDILLILQLIHTRYTEVNDRLEILESKLKNRDSENSESKSESDSNSEDNQSTSE